MRAFSKFEWRFLVPTERLPDSKPPGSSYVMASTLLWNLTKRLPTTEVEFNNIVYAKPSIVKTCKEELLRLIQEARVEGSKNYRDALQVLVDSRQADGDVVMTDADEGAESDTTVTGTKKAHVTLDRPSSTLWASLPGKWLRIRAVVCTILPSYDPTEASGASSMFSSLLSASSAVQSRLFGRALIEQDARVSASATCLHMKCLLTP